MYGQTHLSNIHFLIQRFSNILPHGSKLLAMTTPLPIRTSILEYRSINLHKPPTSIFTKHQFIKVIIRKLNHIYISILNEEHIPANTAKIQKHNKANLQPLRTTHFHAQSTQSIPIHPTTYLFIPLLSNLS